MIPTANIIVAFDSDKIRDLFVAANGSYASLIKKVESGDNENVLLFNNKANPNFISLKHNLGGNNELELKLIDPQGEFEERFLAGTLEDMFATNLDFISDSPASTKSAQKANKTVQEQLKQSKAFFQTATARLKENRSTNKLFIAYGLGDNLDMWSGPHLMTIHDMILDIADAKVLTIKMTAEPMPLDKRHRLDLSMRPVDLVLNGARYKIEANSGALDFYSLYTGDKELEDIYESQTALAPQNSRKKVNKGIDFHTILVDTLKDYIRKATGNDNIVVLLPDVNVLLQDFVGTSIANDSKDSIQRSVKFRDAYTRFKNFCQAVGLLDVIEPVDEDKVYNRIAESISARADLSFDDRQLRWLASGKHYAALISNSNTGVPDHYAVIRKVVENLFKKSLSSTKQNKFVFALFYETDLELVNYFADLDLQRSPSFSFEKKGIKKNKPLIVLGDRQLIANYLYGLGAEKVTYDSVLHSTDQYTYNPKYRIDARKLVTRKKLGMGPFGDTQFIPDDFMHIDEAQAEKKIVEKAISDNNISVFRYNTVNPNVAKIKINSRMVYRAVFNTVINRKIDNYAAQSFGGVIKNKFTNFDLPSPGALIAWIRTRHLSLGDDSEAREAVIKEIKSRLQRRQIQFQPQTPTPISKQSAEEQARYIFAWYNEKLQKAGNSAVLELDQFVGGDPLKVANELAEELYRKEFELEIDTLPSFHISSYADIVSPLLLFAEIPKERTTKPRETGKMDVFLSGFYSIVGATHVISANNVGSKFSIIKQPTLTSLPNTNDSFELGVTS